MMREDRIRLFFLPPNSYQLNALEWLMTRLKQAVATTAYANTKELSDAALAFLGEVSTETIQACLRESEDYFLKAVHAANF
jgi:hypothetical protein